MPQPISDKTFARRPWIDPGTVIHALYSLNSTMHADLYAFGDGETVQLVAVEYSIAGGAALARDWYAVTGDELVPAPPPFTLPPALYWSRSTAPQLDRVHRALVTRARENCAALLAGHGAVALHCHYIRVPDADPWPRGWINYASVPASERRRLDKPRRAYRSRTVRVGDTLPDWL